MTTSPPSARPFLRFALLALAWTGSAVAAAGAARAQEPGEVRVGLTYRPGYLPAMGLPATRTADRGLEDAAARVDSILQRDLRFSDRFDMLAVPDSAEDGTGTRYELWNSLGAQWLVTAHLSGSPEEPLLRVTLHDVVYRRLEEVQAFTLPAPGARGFRMALHRVSDRVVRWATGEPGMAASRIAFRRKAEAGASDIWAVDSDGRNLRRVTGDSTIVYSPAFSPDGGAIAYVSYRSGEPVVYERDLASGEVRVVSDRRGVNLTPAYRPDGERILVARTMRENGRSGGSEIVELQLDPVCCARRLTDTSPGDALNPSYGPDGERFAFAATPLGEQQVYVQRVGGGGIGLISRYLYGERGSAAAPDWSPDGERIAYQAWIDGRWHVVSVNPDDSDRRVLTTDGTNEEPSWAPDGRHLVFRSTREGYHALWVLDTVTGSFRRLVSGHVDQTPDWSPSLGSPD